MRESSGDAGGVVVADLLFFRGAMGAAGGRAIQHAMQDRLGVLGDHRAGAVAGVIVGNGIKPGEIAACVLKEIYARVGGGVEQAFIQTGEELWGISGAGRGGVLSPSY